MFDLFDPETYWLNATNIVLGVVTLVCLIAVSSTVVRELLQRARQRVPVFAQRDEHTFVLSDLGITMADGGEKVIDECKVAEPRKEVQPKDGSNIFRSNN